MRILDSQLQLSSHREYLQYERVDENIAAFSGAAADPSRSGVQVSIRRSSQSLLTGIESYSALNRQTPVTTSLPLDVTSAPRFDHPSADLHNEEPADTLALWLAESELLLFKLLLEALTGRKIELPEIDSAAPDSLSLDPIPNGSTPLPATNSGFRIELSTTYSEAEITAFSVSGDILSANGDTIRLDFNVLMSRQFSASTTASLQIGEAPQKDPLVLTFGGGVPRLSEQSYRFDIDADGQ